jgi:predicted  nucleic acid-binding Zn-ribbon protein
MSNSSILIARDPGRKALRAAIADAETARRNLEDARSAARKAEDHVYDAKHRLAALREDNAKAGVPEAFLSRLADDNELDVLELDRPGAECRARIDTAEQEVATWRRVHEAAKLAVNDRERHLPLLGHKVADAARDVIRNSEAAARLMDGLAAMQDDVARRRGALQFLLHKQLLPDSAKADVAHLLRADVDSHLDTEWQAAFDDLKRDADAPLPGDNEVV